MKRSGILTAAAAAILMMAFTGCRPALEISNVDYSQPVETVLNPDSDGNVDDVQHGLRFSILPLQYAETGDSTQVTTRQIRMIRGSEGYYYITSDGYKHVYVMTPKKNRLSLEKKILVSEEGIAEPAFNQRQPYILLLNRRTGDSYAINSEGIQNEPKQQSD